jgi:uncharacterized protein (TIGR00266 family)
MRSHEIDYEILGEDIQVVQIELDPSETVVAEAGSMLFMEDGIQFETRMGDGSQTNDSILGKIFKAGSRVLMGESLFMTHFTNKGQGKKKVAFAAPYPGTIKAVDLAQIKGNTLIVQKDAFLCAAMGTQISIHFNKKFGAGLFGGEGFILEKIQGDGLAFIHSGGVVIEKTLNNETLRIDTGCIVGYEPQLNFDIQRSGGMRSMVFGGEGMFLATLSGTGKVWIQSMPISKLIQRIAPYGGNSRKEGGSVIGGLADIFER